MLVHPPRYSSEPPGARHLGMPIVTAGRKIRDYAKAGHVNAIPC